MGEGIAGQLAEGHVVGGRYKLERTIGQGAFATVWLASDSRNSDLPVAIKVFHPTRRSADPSYLLRFRNEAELLAKLQHDAIARAIDHISSPGLTAIVLEYVEGRSLRSEMLRRATASEIFELQEIGRVMDALLDALQHAHDVGAIHRDVKPANLVVRALRGSASSAITVLDFGVAKLVDLDAHEATTIGRMLGTISYMAPEQTRGEPVDHRSDLFSVAVILFELLTLRRLWNRDAKDVPAPFAGGPSAPPSGVPAIVSLILRGKRPKPSAFRDDIPPGLDDLVLRSLEVDRANRFPSAAAMRRELVPLLGVELGGPRAGLVPPRLTAGVPVWNAEVSRAVEQRVDAPWLGLYGPQERVERVTTRVGGIKRELQRLRHRRLAAAIADHPRLHHLVVDEDADRLVLRGPFVNSRSGELSEVALELPTAAPGFSLVCAAPEGLQAVLDALNGVSPRHQILLARLRSAFTDSAVRKRAEGLVSIFDELRAQPIEVERDRLTCFALPESRLGAPLVARAFDGLAEVAELVQLAKNAYDRMDRS